MRIGVIGAGNVGGALGLGWAHKGHEIMFGVRDPRDPKIRKLLADSGGNATAGNVSQAAAFGTVVALATPWNATREAVQKAGDLAGKVVLDCTNPLKADLSGLDVPAGTSGGETVAGWASNARVVKIFNTTGFANIADAHYADLAPTMLYCGNEEEAKSVAAKLATDLGFEPVDAGNLRAARMLESLALLWIHLAHVRGMGTGIAFGLLRR